MDTVCHGGEGIQKETLSIMVGKVFRDGYSLLFWRSYIGRDIGHHSGEGIQGRIESVMVGKVYRRRHSSSW